MGDLVNFPTWLIEKERELNRLELTLAMREEWLDAEIDYVESEKANHKAKIIISFFAGVVLGTLLVIPFT
jgi:hypothetical protein